ncbi:amino acid-binding protein [Nocardioides sp. GY 10113]|uniref:ABC transporter substrate-binding protein n=1 Tax=Nocardioides sp. GY 10113 TaxID=2569761 RepID=UPI0010A815FF|nr:ABC transporter substrate-binding protein [Nocardioides sp. GY 10113]TIC80646.1 amino acid-binding protein [Nocardioides sp. GY 10113]
MNRSTTTRRSWRPAAAAAAVLAASTAISACGAGTDRESSEESTGSSVGVTDDTIKIGGHFPLTGVAAPGYSEIPAGAQAYYDFVNANGGVNGRQIEFLVKDDAYDPTKTSSVTNELVLQEEVFGIVGGLGTPTHGAVVDFLNDEEVPDLFVSSGSRQWGETPDQYPFTFGWQPDYVIEGKVIGQYIAENLPDAKVGLFLQGDDLGEDGEAGIRQYADGQIVETVTYTPGNTDIAPQIAKLQAAGADLVVGFNVPSYTALSQLVSLKLGFQPQWIYSNIGSDPDLVGSLLADFSEGAVKDGAALLGGVITTEYMPGIGDDDAWMQLWEKVWDEQGGKGDLTNYKIYGMAEAYTFVQALQAAGEDLTREGIVSAIEEVGSTFEGPGYGPFRYSADSHLGLSGIQVVEIEGSGASKALTPVLVTDLGDAPIEEDDSAAGDAPPASGLPEVEPAS